MYLLAALKLNDVTTDADHSQMTAVIHCKTPYIVAGKEPFVLPFALNNDVSLCSVLDLSPFRRWVLIFIWLRVYCYVLN